MGCSSSPAGREQFLAACQAYRKQFGELQSFSRYEAAPNIFWNDELYSGEAYGAYGWAVYMAEVTVDTTTYSVTIDDFVALQEIGKVLHPVLAGGQIEGGIAQGIGYALYEKVIWKDGRMINNQMTNYIMPTAEDIPPIRVYFEEVPYQYGPYGAKGIGELPMDGPGTGDHQCCGAGDRHRVQFHSIVAGRYLPRLDRGARAAGRISGDRAGGGGKPMSRCDVSFTVNGTAHTVSVYPMERLLDVLRTKIGLTGTKEGCGEGECGSCSVLMNGELVNSCLVPVLQAEGATLCTIEGLAGESGLHRVQQAFLKCGGAQCGICTPGMVMATVHLLNHNPTPTLEQIREGLGGNLCRCTGYTRIFDAVMEAAGTQP